MQFTITTPTTSLKPSFRERESSILDEHQRVSRGILHDTKLGYYILGVLYWWEIL